MHCLSIMKKIILIALMSSALLGLIGCQSLWHQILNAVVDIAPDRFTFEEDQKKISIPIITSHPLDKNNNETEYLVIMIHGGGLNAGGSFKTGQQIIESLKMPKDRFLVLAPQIIEGVKLEEKGLLFWDRKWREGGMSLSTRLNKDLPSLSSFEVIDRLIDGSIKMNPGIHRIIILGHSAGGQFVARYAAINSRHELLEQQGVSIQYVVANPSSYTYLDKARYQLNSKDEILEIPQEEFMNCSGYNKYKYGLEEMYGYAEALSPQLIRTRLLTRPVMFVLGTADTDRNWSLDKSCEGEAQGENRYQRGLLYKHHLGNYVKISLESQYIWLEIPEVGHDSTEIFTHPKFITKIKTLDF
jgi:pimeloyl-ACP methyl ester carboxylesterase